MRRYIIANSTLQSLLDLTHLVAMAGLSLLFDDQKGQPTDTLENIVRRFRY